MFATAAIFAATFSAPELVKWVEANGADVSIVVFRHHPGLLDTRERMKARDRDEEVILKMVQQKIRALSYSGGGGSGYELAIPARSLGRWKREVDKLIKDGTLKYYDRWELDRNGYGFVPVR